MKLRRAQKDEGWVQELPAAQDLGITPGYDPFPVVVETLSRHILELQRRVDELEGK